MGFLHSIGSIDFSRGEKGTLMVQLASKDTIDKEGRINGQIRWSVPAWFVTVVTGVSMLALVWVFGQTLINAQELAKGERFTEEDALAHSRRLNALEIQQIQILKNLSQLPPQSLKDAVRRNSEAIQTTRESFAEIMVTLRVLEKELTSLHTLEEKFDKAVLEHLRRDGIRMK